MEDELLALESEFALAVIRNDAGAVAKFLDEDWVIIDPDGGVVDKARFLEVIRSGVLTHSLMESTGMRVRIYQDAAVVTGLTNTEGTFMGQEFASCERATDIFVKRAGRWHCVFTQLTRFNKK